MNKTEIFIQKATKVHGLRYDYSKTIYIKNQTKICIICPEHGEFWQTPHNHLSGQGCPKCAGVKNYTTLTWVEAAKKIHGDKYDYSKVVYERSNKKVCIICPEHGEFWQTPNNHLRKRGCFKCNKNHNRYNNEKWINEAKKIHGDKYDYSLVEYRGAKEKIKIICPKHGIFYQTPTNHLSGKGCQICRSSHIEDEIRDFLNRIGINFIEQKRFGWLGYQSLDFYIPHYNVAIECQGIQHFEKNEYFGGNDMFIQTAKRDKLKYELCKTNGIRLLYYANYDYDFPYKVYTNKSELLKDIQNEVK